MDVQERLKAHPVADIFPLMERAKLAELAEDIRQNGLLEPVVLLDGMILDGRNRMAACDLANVTPRFDIFEGADPLQYVVSKNLIRRHLRETQRAMVAAKLASAGHGGDRRSPAWSRGAITIPESADMLSVSERSVHFAKAVLNHGTDELVALVENGRVSVSAAAHVSKLAEAEQAMLVASGVGALVAAGRKTRAAWGRKKRSEYGVLWDCVDAICVALEERDISSAAMMADRLASTVREMNRKK